MSPLDTVMPMLAEPWISHACGATCITPMRGLRREAIVGLESYWSGILTPDMRQLLSTSCGLTSTPLGSIDFTGRWYSKEPLSVFQPSITLAVDEKGRRWITETGRKRGLPGPVWCVFPQPEVAMFVDRNLGEFLSRLYCNARRDGTSQWLAGLNARARLLWASRYARAISVATASRKLKEIRGWLARLPLDAWVYDVRAPDLRRGLPYGLTKERGELYRCGRLPVFAFAGVRGPAAGLSSQSMATLKEEGSYTSPLPIRG